MLDAYDGHRLGVIVDLVEDAIIAHPDAPPFQCPDELAHTVGTRVIAQGQDPLVDPLKKGAGQPAQVPLRRALDEESVQWLRLVGVWGAKLHQELVVRANRFIDRSFQACQVG